jgi:2-dehydro-3-deoxyphosphogluconate aldolase/(4S)-4-hydroxy-2-oxoglutarate aldolase
MSLRMLSTNRETLALNQPSTLDSLKTAGIIAVLRAPSAGKALTAVHSLVAGGVTGIEITYTTPQAAKVIAHIHREYGGAVYLGAGTVTMEHQAKEAVDAGAQFLVSPGIDPVLITTMLATGVAVFPGALTPTEVMAATRLGAHAVKIFPASLVGPAYLRALRGPFPAVSLLPTGGINSNNLMDWMSAGAVAVGVGSELCPSAAMAESRWSEIEATARYFVDAFASARAQVSHDHQ